MSDTRMEIIKSMNYANTDNILSDMKSIIEAAQHQAYQAVNTTLVKRNWLIGQRIVEEELKGTTRTDNYRKEIMKSLSQALTKEYGKGFDVSSLYKFKKFYEVFPDILDSLSPKSSGQILSWTHYRVLLQIEDMKARKWYEKEACQQTWSVRTLQRNISSQYYYRMLRTQKPDMVESEMKALTGKYQNDKYEFIKNPVIAEFLGMAQSNDFTESDLESSILSNLQRFLMKLGKGYALY